MNSILFQSEVKIHVIIYVFYDYTIVLLCILHFLNSRGSFPTNNLIFNKYKLYSCPDSYRGRGRGFHWSCASYYTGLFKYISALVCLSFESVFQANLARGLASVSIWWNSLCSQTILPLEILSCYVGFLCIFWIRWWNSLFICCWYKFNVLFICYFFNI